MESHRMRRKLTAERSCRQPRLSSGGAEAVGFFRFRAGEAGLLTGMERVFRKLCGSLGEGRMDV